MMLFLEYMFMIFELPESIMVDYIQDTRNEMFKWDMLKGE
jgi:hypothetical protein